LENGYVKIPTGRLKYYETKGLSRTLRHKVWREATNAPVQGMASDMSLSGCVDLWGEGLLDMLIYRHDEADHRGYTINQRGRAKEILHACPILQKMGIKFPIPIIVDMEVL